ncbi:MAG: MBOAT family protein [Bacteroidetes bacterium]|nr:MBOAT family protein [Bacteroidota bacterium]
MVFNSLNYLLFVLLSWLAFNAFPQNIRWAVLLVSGILFYLSFVPVFALLILLLGGMNYRFGLILERKKLSGKPVSVAWFVAFNVAFLALFKYFDYLVPVTDFSLLNWRIFQTFPEINHWIIPIGLSYISFTLISYLIEINRGKIQAERNAGVFAVYLFFFPKVAQGPIERPQNLLPQLRHLKTAGYLMIVEGLKLIVWGYFKKLVVADRLAIYVDAVYNNYSNHSGLTLAFATVLYAFQLYADFSGYTDIAIGTAKLFGIDLTQNFKRPYLSTSLKDFWSRWHITFSSWLRDYLFLPLALYFSRKMKKNRYAGVATELIIYTAATLITFVICGLWHGETLNYLAWGLLFGIMLSIANKMEKSNKMIRKKLHLKKESGIYKLIHIPITFLLVVFTFVFFRSPSLDGALDILNRIPSVQGSLFTGEPDIFIYSLLGIFLLIVFDLKQEFFENRFRLFESKKIAISMVSYALLIGLIGLFGVFDGGQFIYFQF